MIVGCFCARVFRRFQRATGLQRRRRALNTQDSDDHQYHSVENRWKRRAA